MESTETKMTADQLAKEGERRGLLGDFVVFLYQSQEWMAVEAQMPFRRYKELPRV